ncbi:MAG: hypothetical protein AB7Q16_23325 [Vicinamibacterales bacterium]
MKILPSPTHRPRSQRRRRARSVGLLMAVLVWPMLALAQPAGVTGLVRDSVTHAPLANVLLSLCDEGGCIVEPTSASGTYMIAAAPGSYHLFTRNSIGYTNEFHDNLLCQQECASDPVRFSATPVVLSPGVTFTGTSISIPAR